MKPKQRAGYVLNKRSGVMHRLPTQERCNLDQVLRKFRSYFFSEASRGFAYRTLCWFCFPDPEQHQI